MASYISDKELVDQLRAKLDKKTQRALAAEMGISQAYLSDFLNGRRNAGPLILRKLGYDPTPYYRKSPRGSSYTADQSTESAMAGSEAQ